MKLIAEVRIEGRAVPWSTPETIMVPAANDKRRAVHKKDRRLIAWQDAVRAACRAAYRGDPYAGPVHLEADFVCGTNDDKLWGWYWWSTKPGAGHPDATNLQKAVEDSVASYRDRKHGLVIPGVIANDSQVCSSATRKRYGPEDLCEISVYALE